MLGTKLAGRAFKRARTPYEGAELAAHYPEPWFVRERPGREFWWRFALGRPLDGRRWTNCTFFRCATSGEPNWWLRLAGWQRLAVRLGSVWTALLALTLPLLMLTVPGVNTGAWVALTTVSALPLLLPLTVLTAHRTVRAHGLVLPRWERVEPGSEQDAEEGALTNENSEQEQEQGALPVGERSRFYERWKYAPVTIVEGARAWERDVVLPLARAVAPQIHRAYHPDTAPTWCIVPRDYAKPDGAPVRILLPAQFTGVDDRANRRLVRTIKTRLALDDMVPRFLLENTSTPELQLVTPVAPPKFLSLADVRHHMEGAAEFEPFLGQVAGGEGLHLQMVGDSPHTAISAGPGAGKTTTLKALACQFRAWGWSVIILDWKRSEANMWAWGLDGVRVISEVQDIHDLGVSIGEEIDYRRNAHPDERAELPRIVVIRNEWNATADLLMQFWTDLRGSADADEKRDMTLKSPALRAYAQLVFCGRELGMFDVVEAQRLSARVFNGNADIRSCYRNLLMARYDWPTVRMLIGDPARVKLFPKSPKETGRWTVDAGGETHVVQVPYLTNEEAREFALSGKPGVASPWSVRRGPRLAQPPNRVHMDSTQGEPLGHGPTRTFVASSLGHVSMLELEATPTAPRRLIKLSEWAEEWSHLGITLNVLQHERKRDPDFPPAIDGNPKSGYRYDADVAAEWTRRRHARMAAEDGRK